VCLLCFCLICVVSPLHSRHWPYIIGRRWRLLQVIFAVVEEGLLLHTPIDGLLVVQLHILAESDQLNDGLASFQMILKFLRRRRGKRKWFSCSFDVHKMEVNLKNLTAHQSQVFEFFFIVDQSIAHLLLDLVHLKLQVVAVLDELVNVEVLLVLHVYQLRLELGDSLCQLGNLYGEKPISDIVWLSRRIIPL
jgi:hypothetical protein